MPEDEIPTTEEVTEVEIETPEAPAIEEPVIEGEPVITPPVELDPETVRADAAEKKFGESTRENQILTAKLTQYEQEQLNNQPTEDDLRKAFPTFDYMTDTEKDLARGTYLAKVSADEVLAEKRQRDKDSAWNRDIETFVLSEPKLHGQEDKFRQFANKKTHRGAPLNVLKSAFFYETPVTPPAERAPGLEPGSGGPRDAVKKTLGGTDLQQLRVTNYEAYKEYVKTHDIEI